MKHIAQNSTREGFVIVITLVLLLVMTTMGIGLFYETKKTANQVRSNNNNTETLYSAESCIAEARRWLSTERGIRSTPCESFAEGSVCMVIGEKYMGDTLIRIDPIVSSDSRLSAHYYRCEITRLRTVSTEISSSGGSGDGEEGYDESDDIETIISSTSYYKIRSKACVSTSGSCDSDNPNITIVEEIVKIN